MAAGKLTHELELPASASQVWELYSSGLQLANFVVKELPNLIAKVDVIKGEGGEGTVLKLTFPPGQAGPTGYTEKFMKVDNENRLKESQAIEGGLLEMGFTLYLVRFEVMEKGEESSVIKTTVEYEVKEEAAANACFASVQPFADIAEAAKLYFLRKKNTHADTTNF